MARARSKDPFRPSKELFKLLKEEKAENRYQYSTLDDKPVFITLDREIKTNLDAYDWAEAIIDLAYVDLDADEDLAYVDLDADENPDAPMKVTKEIQFNPQDLIGHQERTEALLAKNIFSELARIHYKISSNKLTEAEMLCDYLDDFIAEKNKLYQQGKYNALSPELNKQLNRDVRTILRLRLLLSNSSDENPSDPSVIQQLQKIPAKSALKKNAGQDSKVGTQTQDQGNKLLISSMEATPAAGLAKVGNFSPRAKGKSGAIEDNSGKNIANPSLRPTEGA